MQEYYAFQLQNHDSVYSTILHNGRLFQEYVVKAYCSILEERFQFIRRNEALFFIELCMAWKMQSVVMIVIFLMLRNLVCCLYRSLVD